MFDGIGAVSGGGGNARLLIDYPPRQRAQILDYLFGPGGADLQVLKLEIGGDTASSDGAEPSVEHSKGQIDCQSGYSWWLAEQAVARNPAIKLAALQWSAPGWIGGSVWDAADISYVIEWLNCAKSHGLRISYLGGWNEHPYNIGWFESLRRELDANGYGSVKLVAADAWPGRAYDPASTWQVADALATDPAFRRAIGVVGAHDTCGGPTTGYRCESTKTARKLGLPLWETELGAMHGGLSGAAAMARSINNGFIQAGLTGFLEWPLTDAMTPGLPYANRGLVDASRPQSGHYHVNRMVWAIAQTTQFVKPGWRHVLGAAGALGRTGTFDAYASPDRRDWSLVAENVGNRPRQHAVPQTITVRLTGGLAKGIVHVWSTNLSSGTPADWFVRRRVIHPRRGMFSYTIKPGYVVSFTSTVGQRRYRYPVTAKVVPLRLPYEARPDASNEAWGLAGQDGAFVYMPCIGGVAGQCLEQMADQIPIWWQRPLEGTPAPYALTGDPGWTSYTVATNVLFTTASSVARLIGRFSRQVSDSDQFSGYEFDLAATGNWQLTINSCFARPRVLASGAVPAVPPDSWHSIALRLAGSGITASIDGSAVTHVTNRRYRSGLAGIGSNWTQVQFNGLTIR